MTEIDAKYTVGDIMTKNVTSVNENATLEEMLEIMGEGKFQALPITEDGNIVGIVSNRDLVRVYDWEKNHGEGSYSSGGAGFGI
jgi:CBS domain-containing protein